MTPNADQSYDNRKKSVNYNVDFKQKLSKAFTDLSFERKIYLVLLLTTAVASVANIFFESVEIEAKSRNGKLNRVLGPGWRTLSRKQDIADFEWTFWFSDLRESIIAALVGHVIISYFASRYLKPVRHTLQALYCIYWVRAALGPTFILIVVSYCATFYVVSALSKSRSMCWILTITSILLLHFDSFYMEVLPSTIEVDGTFLSLAYVSLGFVTLRCCSYAFESIDDRSSKKGQQYGFHRLLQYNFYLPYFFFGPVMTYDVYIDETMPTHSKDNLLNIFKEVAKTMAGIAVIDFLLHFVHVSSVALDLEYMQTGPVYVVGFLLFANVMLDWMKAWVLYGVTSNVSNVVDGYKRAPQGPKCLATICTFADTYFDRGIQHWVCRYIYDPVGEHHSNVTKETIASVLTFIFVTLWQGPGIQVIIWATLNCLGLTFEFFLGTITPQEDKSKKRLVAFILGLNYWCILLFNTVGISGMETARISAKAMFFNGSLWNFTVAVVLGYCYAAFITLSPTSKDKTE
uniref:protein-cysteine N-palmitoyltransferase HHAT-like protein n=1 Tax=Styela clava TaxID=7725 RepID=UPI00193A51C0|nr:protein-cysteine N-palmitoyltransferase HHAT-like protein [Styela clava]